MCLNNFYLKEIYSRFALSCSSYYFELRRPYHVCTLVGYVVNPNKQHFAVWNDNTHSGLIRRSVCCLLQTSQSLSSSWNVFGW